MTWTVEEPSPKQRIMVKALVLGTDIALQAGFVTQACQQGVSLHMYSILGVALGISRKSVGLDSEVVLQMWTIPTQERLPGLTKQFARGHRAAVILIRPDEIDSLEQLLRMLNEESKRNLLVIVLDSDAEDGSQIERLTENIGANGTPMSLASVEGCMTCLCEKLALGLGSESSFPSVGFLDSGACSTLEQSLTFSGIAPSTPQEVTIISNNAVSLGYQCVGSNASKRLLEGEINIDLKTGKILFKPALCKYCVSPCKKEVNICIVAVDSGWASREIGGLALLTLAKLAAFSNRNLPEHVENQIRRACSCSEFEIACDNLETDSIFEELRIRGYVRTGRRLNLLDIAKRKVRDGGISQSVFDTLRNSLKRVESLTNDGDHQ